MSKEKLSSHNEAVNDQEEMNWLDGDHTGKWKTVTFKGDMSDARQREEKEKIIRAYIRGWLEIYNDESNRNYKVKRVEIRNNYGGDTRFTIKAFIDPPPVIRPHAEGEGNGLGQAGGLGGSHLVPPPPPPPDDV